MVGKVMQSLLQLSERWPCHVWLDGRMRFSSLEANLSLGQGLLVNPILRFCIPSSGRSPGITEILLTWMLNLNKSINPNNYITTI